MTKREQVERENTRRAIRQALGARGKTQNWLAKEVGIAASTLSDILRGRHQPSLNVAMSIERVTGVPAERFVRS
jgi:DNA-binding XRE family transcriptional regulator